MATHIQHRERVIKNGRNRKSRPKTFKTEESAKTWAESQGMKSFDLVRLTYGISKKIKVVAKE